MRAPVTNGTAPMIAKIQSLERALSVVQLMASERLVKAGVSTGASTRNWNGYGKEVTLEIVNEWERQLLTDPQTSGGLLVACSPESEAGVLEVFRRHGFDAARAIGRFSAGAGLTVTA